MLPRPRDRTCCSARRTRVTRVPKQSPRWRHEGRNDLTSARHPTRDASCALHALTVISGGGPITSTASLVCSSRHCRSRCTQQPAGVSGAQVLRKDARVPAHRRATPASIKRTELAAHTRALAAHTRALERQRVVLRTKSCAPTGGRRAHRIGAHRRRIQSAQRATACVPALHKAQGSAVNNLARRTRVRAACSSEHGGNARHCVGIARRHRRGILEYIGSTSATWRFALHADRRTN